MGLFRILLTLLAAASALALGPVACSGNEDGGKPDAGSGGHDGGGGGEGTGGRGGGDGTGGIGGDGGAAGPGTFVFEGEVDGVEYSGRCTAEGSLLDVTHYAAGVVGDQINVGCPGTGALALQNPAAYVIIKAYVDLDAEFAFTEADEGYGAKFEFSSGTRGLVPRDLNAHSDNVQSVLVNGTWDVANNHLTVDFEGEWAGSTDDDLSQGNGWVRVSFDVIVATE